MENNKWIVMGEYLVQKPEGMIEKPEKPIELQAIERGAKPRADFSTNDHVDYFYELHQWEAALSSQPRIKRGDNGEWKEGQELEKYEDFIVEGCADDDCYSEECAGCVAIPVGRKYENECPKCGRIDGKHFAVCDYNK